MISSIHISQQVLRKVETLSGLGKKEQLIAERYKEIIDYLQTGNINNEELLLKRTRYGESRLANCLKYNLGLGYRLVTIKKRSKLFLIFLGSHEETNHWIRKNKNYLPSENDTIYSRTITLSQNETPIPLQRDEDEPTDDEYESKLLNSLDENTLKDVFSGLYAHQQK